MKLPIKAITAAIAMIAGTAIAAPTADFQFGITTVKADAGFLAAATSLGVKVSALHGNQLRFPIVAGSIDLANAAGEIVHTNGISLKAGTTVVELRNFIIDTTGAKPILTGLVVANETTVGRIPLFDLTLPTGLTLPLAAKGRFRTLALDQVGLKLTDTAAAALNGAFSVQAFAKGLVIGTAKVEGFGLRN